MRVITCDQYSDEYWAAKLGIPTSSNFDKLVTTKGKTSIQRKKYMFKLAGEVILGHCVEGYQSQSMANGLETEAEAREFYEFTSGTKIEQVGFCISDDSKCGSSPDGLVETDGCLEIKCPEIHTHVGYMLNPDSLKTSYFQQAQGQMLVTDRKWVDLISYFSGMKPVMVRIECDKEFIDALKKEIDVFYEELQTTIKQLEEK